MRIVLAVLMAMGWMGTAAADDLDEYLLRPAPGALERVVRRYGLEIKKALPERNLYLVRPVDNDDFEDDAKGDPDVVAVERNEAVYAPEIESGSTSPNERPLEEGLLTRRMVNYFGMTVWEGYTTQPATKLIGLAEAQRRGARGAGVVAVIDTGVDPKHPALAGALTGGYDFTRDQAGAPDEMRDVEPEVGAVLTQSTTAFIDTTARPVPLGQYSWAALAQSTTAFIDTGKLPAGFGHGTMVASVIRLTAPGAKIMPLKAFRSDGSSNTFDLVRAIYFAADQGARVINMSFHMQAPSPELRRAVNYAAARRVVLVASTGNGGNEVLVWPAALGNVMGVASTDMGDQRSGFSNYGPELVTMAAPGEGILVAYPGNNYASAWGTSFSAPFVAGAAAILLQRDSSLTPAGIERILSGAARVLEPGLGAGRLYLKF